MVLHYKAPAKINWFIYVTGKRDDGYHDLLSVMQRVSLYDELTVEPAGAIEVVTGMDIPTEDNLVFKAASLLRSHTGCKKGARIHLKKEIPTEAGLGGGSSDCACTLLALNSLWGLGLTTGQLMELGAMLGSDVPFFVGGACAFVSGRGEVVTPMQSTTPWDVLIIKPPFSVSTAWAYKKLRTFTSCASLNHPNDHIGKRLCDALNNRDVNALIPLMRNDIQEAIQGDYPMIGELRSYLLEHGAVAAMLSGSGSAVFGVFGDTQKAQHAREHLPVGCRGFLVTTLTN
ncbi:MAG: 4-(cytidine 5'-diphospho)-2-C-methyl-D-erythritol kinase [Magnetococcales bacterium]|nr:4-(cytidine 5'-diphospho)-2-C-methyl-D-erythritol kinase [Nitrospirota bacterium]